MALERRQPVALLPERTAAPRAQWLREPPGVEGIARDRSPAYAEGARHEAPAATQVADRFHLWQHLKAVLDHVFTMPEKTLDAVPATLRPQPVPLAAGPLAVLVPPHDIALPAQQRAAQRQALHQQGWTAPAIAQQVGLGLRTVQRDLQSATWAGRTRRSDLGESVLNPYKPYVLACWNAGCHTARQRWRELQPRGYTGSSARVAAYARRLRQAQGLAPGHRRPRQALPSVAEPVSQPLPPRRATWLGRRREAKRTEAEAQQLTQLHAPSAEVAEAIALAQDCAQRVRAHQPEHRAPW